VDETRPEDLATILYTSGTTGRPRGVMLSQRNLAGNTVAACEMIQSDSRETRLCFLPLSHIYARTCDLYSWVYMGSRLALAESRDTVIRDCGIVQPAVLNAVPYFYQKVHDRICAAEPADPAQALCELFGGKIERCFSGGAPLAPDVERWFVERGLPVLVGYGLTESSPVISMSTASTRRPGSVGRPLPGVDVRIADDGEVLARGPNIMMGYWQDVEGTRTTIRDGWLYTGDLGQLDEDGFLYIRGRKKELIVLSTGKKVAPTRVEGLLAASPLIEQVAVVGDGRSCLGALIVPCADELRLEAERRRTFEWPDQGALRHLKVREMFTEEIARRLACAAREEQVHTFVLLERAFSIERGELTPKLSLRRDVIGEHFREEIETMYADDGMRK
jgi:long-chain acyl-CoA synthetase